MLPFINVLNQIRALQREAVSQKLAAITQCRVRTYKNSTVPMINSLASRKIYLMSLGSSGNCIFFIMA